MGRKAAILFTLFAVATLLGGCPADKPPQIESNLYPKEYQQEIIATLKKDVFDKNATVRVSDAFVSAPAMQPVGKEQHYISCVRYTSRGGSGEIASATRIGYFYGGHLNQLVPAGSKDCAGAAYQPFPKLDQVCIGKGCK